MKKLLGTALLLASLSVNADLYGGAHYTEISDDILSLGGAGVTLGYELATTPKTSFIGEIRTGVGIKDDTYESYYDVALELDSYYIFTAKGKYITDSGVYLLALASQATIEVTASFDKYSDTASETEAGFGLGLGYDFETSGIDTELTFETFDDSDLIAFNVKFDF